MTLPGSGAITTEQIRVELGYAPGATVTIPSADVRTLCAKPSGDIILPNDFWGKSSSVTITLNNGSLYSLGSGCSFQLQTDGDCVGTEGGSLQFEYDYISDASAIANYEVRATKTSGTHNLGGSSMSTWLSLSSLRTWTLSAAGAGLVKTCVATFEIRRISDGTIMASCSVNFTTEGDDGGIATMTL